MPKIIENLKPRLIAEAKEQVRRSGYAAMTIRSVAQACGVAVGTVYNYFPSKDVLMAVCMLEDWNQCMASVLKAAAGADSWEPVVRAIYQGLRSYIDDHAALFGDADAVFGYATTADAYHKRMRAHLAAPLRRFCASDYEAEFIAEALITWTIENKGFDEILSIIKKLFAKEN